MAFHDAAFGVYAISAVGLALHLIALDTYSGAVRGREKVTPNQEDTGKKSTVGAIEPEPVARVTRAHRNLFANGVLFLVLGLVMVLAGTEKTTAIAYFATFHVARVAYTFAYLGGKQPWRSIFYATGQLAIIGIGYQVVRAAIVML